VRLSGQAASTTSGEEQSTSAQVLEIPFTSQKSKRSAQLKEQTGINSNVPADYYDVKKYQGLRGSLRSQETKKNDLLKREASAAETKLSAMMAKAKRSYIPVDQDKRNKLV
jgi:hypothetical protein